MTDNAIQYIPLDSLRLSPKNRRRQRDPDAVDQLAASIAAHGLLQNLTVEASANDDGFFEVVAGGTRLEALQKLQREHVHGNVPVPCRVIANGEAVEASAAENLVRTRLAPADEFDAFKAMADNGKSRDEIAAHFGVARIVVDRSLKLANVHPDLFEVFRNGGMELDQLQALALTDDHELQRSIWFSGDAYQRWAHHIRDRITNREINANSGIARFIGLDAYEAAGGTVRRDLFGKDAWLADRQLLESMAMDRLEATAQELRDDGWSWVEAHITLDYNQLNEYPRGFGDDRAAGAPLPEADAKRLEAIENRQQEIQDLDADDLSDEQEEALRAELDDLERQEETIRAGQHMIWPADVKAQSGCLVYLTRPNGILTIEWARLKPGQKLATGKVSGTARPTSADKAAAKAKPKAPTLSADMVERLHLHQRAALRHAIVNDHARAIELLLAQLLADLFSSSVAASLFSVRVSNHHASDIDGKAVQFADVKASPARKALDTQIAALKAKLPKKASDIQAWLASQTVDQLHALLALVAAVSLDTSKPQAAALANQVKLDMAQWWRPDADHYLGHVSKAVVAEAVREVHGKDAAAKIEAGKKDAAVAEAGKLLANTGWLPKPLRGNGYQPPKPAKAPKPAPAKAAKAKPKKATATAAAPGNPAVKKSAAKKPANKPTVAKKAAPKKPAAKSGKAAAS
ncbi:MAG TPA: ParB/RepB/Spo0J family partition protein [Luteimonas sp.]|nr:ParB/RepB/Spo0J family partition protein [Luteimonas sp.]